MGTQETSSTFEALCPHCKNHLSPRVVEVAGRFVQAGYFDCDCEGAKAERDRTEKRTLDQERKEAADRLIRRYEAAGIPPRYLKAEHEKASSLANMVSNGEGLYIFGSQGTKKTHIAMAVSRILIANGKVVRVAIVPTLLESMRNRRVEDRDLTATLSTCQVLVLDDLGKEAPTAYACERLFDIVNARYNALLPVIVTSNYDLDSVAKRLTEGETGRSIASRLRQMCKQIRRSGEDVRLRG